MRIRGPLPAFARRALPWLALFGAASAAPPVRVAVIDAPTPVAERAHLVDAIWAARAALPTVSDALAAPDLSVTLISEGESAYDAEWGAAELKAARAAYGELDVELAARLADEAARALANAGRRADAQAALMLLAEAAEAAKDPVTTARALRALLTLDAGFAPPEGDLRPSLAKALAVARKAPKGAGSLRLDATPPAQVTVSGRVAGVSPALIEALPAGVHAVGFVADGYVREVRWIEVPADRSVAASATLQPLRKKPLWDQIRASLPGQVDTEEVLAGLRDLKSLIFAEQAIVLEARPASTVGALFDLKAGRRVRVVQVQASGAAAGQALVRALYDDLDPRAPGLDAPPEATQAGPPLHTRWWFWPAVAAGAAAAITIPILVFSDEPASGLSRRKDAGAVILRF